MKVIRPASEDEMVSEFLTAEFDSPRWKPTILHLLSTFGWDESLVTKPNLSDQTENAKRRELLGNFRGYGYDALLFKGFPSVNWNLATISRAELKTLLYAKFPTWLDLSKGSRLVSDGAANVGHIKTQEGVEAHIPEIAKEVRAGKTFPRLILAGSDLNRLVLIEGHARATAYAMSLDKIPDEIEVLVGFSPFITGWIFW